MANYVGHRVVLTLQDNNTLEGYMHSVDANNSKITLESVKVGDSKRTLPGLQNFYCHEIENIEILEETKQEISGKGKKKMPERQDDKKGSRLIKSKNYPPHLERLQIFENQEVLFKNILDKNEAENENADMMMRGNDNRKEPQAEWFTVLDQMSNLFIEAIAYIKKQKVIGVALEGVEIGRNGKLLWLQIGTPDHVFLFDILTIGKDCFEDGLKDILENGNILKVLHNCRFPSDLLFHQYGIKLVNIFDTQVADVFVYRTRQNSWPRHVQGLPACLMHYLSLQFQDVHFMTVRENSRKDDEEVWSRRPAPRQLLEAAAKNVMYLMELRNVLLEKMLEEFVTGVDIYLSQVRDASTEDAKKYQGMAHLLPVAFQDIKQFMVTYRGPVKRVSDDNGFSENCRGATNPNIIVSRDSFWHTGFKVGKGRGVLARDSKEDFPIPGKMLSLSDAGKSDTKTGSPINLTSEKNQTQDSTPKPGFISPSPEIHLTVDSVPKPTVTLAAPVVYSDDERKSGANYSSSGEKLIEGHSRTSLIRAIMQQNKSDPPLMPSIGKRLEDYNLLPAGAMVPKATKKSNKKQSQNTSKKEHFERNQGETKETIKTDIRNLHSRREENKEELWNSSDEKDLSMYLASKNHKKDSYVSEGLSDDQKVPDPDAEEKWSDHSTSLSLFNQGLHSLRNDVSDMKWKLPQNRTSQVSPIEGQIGSHLEHKAKKTHAGNADRSFSMEKSSDNVFCKEGFSQKFQHLTSPHCIFPSQHSTASTGSYTRDQNLTGVNLNIRPMSARFKQLEELIRSQKQSEIS